MSADTKIRLLGWLHIVVGIVGLIAGCIILLMLAFSADRESRAGATLIPIVLMLWVWVFVPGLVGGIGLLLGQQWARVLLILLSVLELVFVPVGTVIGALGLWILLGRSFDEAMPARRALDTAPPPARVEPEVGVLVAIAGVAAGFVVVIGAGYLISGDTAPGEITALFYPATGVLALCIAYAIRAVARQQARRKAELAIPLRVRIDDHTS
ncbi:MAG: hypothetical protein K8S25_07735 [Alphaproteobacteria bacterium]|nr:hypothetical protein [Alphaproteobacteria bacterium]